ncbi:MAG: chorismate-binding protein [Marinifilaceae bacterium]|jgi:isochorismate synthase|nr:chorismate-binding protein [Marinifilaceae bacterium]
MELGEIVELCLGSNSQFYIYSLPGDEDCTIGIQKQNDSKNIQLFSDLFSENGFVVYPFCKRGNDKPVFIKSDIEFNSNSISTSDISFLESLTAKNSDSPKTYFSTSRSLYSSQYSKLKSLLDSEILSKAILSRIVVVDREDLDEVGSVFYKLCKKYKDAFVYIVKFDCDNIWVGATPEILLNVNSFGFQTIALAGTRLPDSDGTVNWSEKEIEEQSYVQDYIEELLDLNNCNYLKSETETVKAGKLCHLKTFYRSSDKLDDNRMISLIEDLHPTPAVCGIPKQSAMDSIIEIESHDREYYAGFIGPVANGIWNLFVNLRCGKLTNNQLVLYVGGGITKDSEEESEWDETSHKSDTLLSVFLKER